MTTATEPATPSDPDAEIELKLSGQPEALELIFASPTICDKSTGRGVTRRLENVYYDTHDQRLRARGLAFRVRRHGRSYVQTLKSNDTEGLVSYRGEWETPLTSSEPDLAVLPVGALEVLQGLVTPEELESQFTTRVKRRVRRIRVIDQKGRESLIEAALDSGTIETRGDRMPIAEIELELLEGSPDALYSLALELDKLAPLRIETRSKSALGYALANGQAPAWHKASGLDLDPHATVEESLRQILRSCVQHWCANEAASLDGRDPEGVHQLRVGIRRLRSAFSVFGHLIEREERTRLSNGAKRIINCFGPARDWDVFSTELLAPIDAARPGDPDLARLLEAATGRASSAATRRCAPRSAHMPTPAICSSCGCGSRRGAGASTPPSRERTGFPGRSWRSPTRCSPSATATPASSVVALPSSRPQTAIACASRSRSCATPASSSRASTARRTPSPTSPRSSRCRTASGI